MHVAFVDAPKLLLYLPLLQLTTTMRVMAPAEGQ